MSLRDAVLWCFTSMNKAVTPINDYQAAEFAKHSVKRRDPMMITMITMLEVESFPTTCVCQRTRPCLDHVPWPCLLAAIWSSLRTAQALQAVAVIRSVTSICAKEWLLTGGAWV